MDAYFIKHQRLFLLCKSFWNQTGLLKEPYQNAKSNTSNQDEEWQHGLGKTHGILKELACLQSLTLTLTWFVYLWGSTVFFDDLILLLVLAQRSRHFDVEHALFENVEKWTVQWKGNSYLHSSPVRKKKHRGNIDILHFLSNYLNCLTTIILQGYSGSSKNGSISEYTMADPSATANAALSLMPFRCSSMSTVLTFLS